MPEYIVKFMGYIQAKDRKEAWQKAMILVRECNLTVLSVSTEPLAEDWRWANVTTEIGERS